MNKAHNKEAKVPHHKKYGLSNDEERICAKLVLGKKTRSSKTDKNVEITKVDNKMSIKIKGISETNISKNVATGNCTKSDSDIERSKYISEMGGILLKQGDHTLQENFSTKKMIDVENTNKSKIRQSLFGKDKTESESTFKENISIYGKNQSSLFEIERTPKIKKYQYASQNPVKLSHMKNIFFQNEIHFSEKMILKEISLDDVTKPVQLRPQKNKRYRILQEIFNQRPTITKFSTADMSMMKSRSFKVGWSKGFTFTVINKQVLNLVKLTSINSDVSLDEFMEVVIEETEFISQGDIPYCQIKLGENILQKYNKIKSYEDVWRLCMSLWGGTGDYNARRVLFSNWLENVCKSLMKVALISIQNEGFYNRILTYLSGHKIYKAAQYAFDVGAPQLALLIANININESQECLCQQILDWKETGAFDLIPLNIANIYALLTGIPNNHPIGWLRNLGMHFWYSTPSKNPLQFAVNNFEAIHEIPKRDILYRIIKLYCNRIINLGALLNPSKHSKEPTDYKLSWLLMQLLTSLQLINVNTNLANHIATKFATQLEDIGKPDWALFVTLFISDIVTRKNILWGILNRNDCDIKKLHISPAWIHLIEANKNEQTENYFVAFYHYVHSKCWQKCHQLITNHILPILIANNEYTIALYFINDIKDYKKFISNWTNDAGFILDFIYLYQNIEVKLENPMKLYGELCTFTKRIKDYPTDTATQRLVISEISKFTTEYFHMVLKEVAVNRSIYLLNSMRMFKQTVMPSDYKYSPLLNSFMYYFKDN